MPSQLFGFFSATSRRVRSILRLVVLRRHFESGATSMQPSHQAYSSMHIKGGLLRARFLFVVLNHGPERWARILGKLSEEDRRVAGDIAVDNWYPLSTLEQIDRAI